jgi:hypothetical protein
MKPVMARIWFFGFFLFGFFSKKPSSKKSCNFGFLVFSILSFSLILLDSGSLNQAFPSLYYSRPSFQTSYCSRIAAVILLPNNAPIPIFCRSTHLARILLCHSLNSYRTCFFFQLHTHQCGRRGLFGRAALLSTILSAISKRQATTLDTDTEVRPMLLSMGEKVQRNILSIPSEKIV